MEDAWKIWESIYTPRVNRYNALMRQKRISKIQKGML